MKAIFFDSPSSLAVREAEQSKSLWRETSTPNAEEDMGSIFEEKKKRES